MKFKDIKGVKYQSQWSSEKVGIFSIAPVFPLTDFLNDPLHTLGILSIPFQKLSKSMKFFPSQIPHKTMYEITFL